MLVRFSVENFKSYKERQIFSMVAGRQTRHKNHVVEVRGQRLLKGSFFFGANAAGKSNLFDAVRFAQSIVKNGIRSSILSNKHFRIEEGYSKKPGVFQFDIYTNEHFYSYGFAVSYEKGGIEEEWLYLCDVADIAIFERTQENNKTNVETAFHFSDEKQRQKFEVFAESVPDEKLLLSEIAERKLIEHPDFAAFKNVWNWFRNLIIISPNSTYTNKNDMLDEGKGSNELEMLLREFDTGIVDISLETGKGDDVLNFLPEKLRTAIVQDVENTLNEEDIEKGKPVAVTVNVRGRSISFRKENNQIVASQLMMNHGNESDPFELSDESDGTKRLFDLIPLYNEGKTPCVIFVDELDRSFHTKLVLHYIERFYQATDGVESQLIASVHDSNVMDLTLLRQDEIWFVERKEDHSSSIYSLNRYQARFDKKVAKDYLMGRYGAIPCFSQLNELGEEDE